MLKGTFIGGSSAPCYKFHHDRARHSPSAPPGPAGPARRRAGAPLHAEPNDHDLARQALQQGKVLPLRTVLDKVEREHQGQVLKIEFEQEDGRFIYEIRLLQQDGRLVKLEVDASSGQVLKIKRKRH